MACASRGTTSNLVDPKGDRSMGIVFFCQSCGARFEVAPGMAGKKGRCKKCSQQTTVPRAEEIASMSAIPALALASVGAGISAGARPAVPTGGSSIGSWIKAGISQIGLAPLSVDRMPLRPTRPSALDDAEDSKPYVLARPVREPRGGVRVQDNFIVRIWRRQLGRVQKLFRTINQAAYLVSIPFLMILILGAVVKNRPVALFGATFVVLINIARLVAGGANLAVIPFRDGINMSKMKKPFRRVIEPAVTIGLVIAAFTFIPWLSSGLAAKGNIGDRIQSSVEGLKKEMKGEVNRVVDVNKLGGMAQDKLKQLGDKAKELDVNKLGAQAQEKVNEFAPSFGGGRTQKP
jgi:hypothetical protein